MFKWKDTYSTGVAEIDLQHQRLLEIGTELYDIMRLKDHYDHYDEIMDILSRLADYTIYHFNYEEGLMEKASYGETELHKLEHRSFVNKISSILKMDIDEKQKNITMDLIMFIADWIEKHILVADAKYKETFRQQGIF